MHYWGIHNLENKNPHQIIIQFYQELFKRAAHDILFFQKTSKETAQELKNIKKRKELN